MTAAAAINPPSWDQRVDALADAAGARAKPPPQRLKRGATTDRLLNVTRDAVDAFTKMHPETAYGIPQNREEGTKLGLVRRTHAVSMLPELSAAFVIDEFMRANADNEINQAVAEQHKAARGVDLIASYLVRQALQHGANHFEVLKHLVTHLYP